MATGDAGEPSVSRVLYSWIGPLVETHEKIIPEKNRKGYDNLETTVGKLSAMRIQICLDYVFLCDPFFTFF